MALPYPQDPASPSAPNPYFQDNNYVRGDQFRAFSGKAWANFTDLDSRLDTAETDISNLQSDVSTLQTDVADLETQVQKTGQPDYRGLWESPNATHPNYQIDTAPGQCLGLDPGGLFCWPIKIASTWTKDINNPFAAGSGNGGMDTGSVAPDTWYYRWAILNVTSGATDVLISASSTSPTLPSGYTVKRRLQGAFLTDGSGNIIMFNQDEDGVVWWTNSSVAGTVNAFPRDVNVTNPGTAAVNRALSVPPLKVKAHLRVRVETNTGTLFGIAITSTASKAIAPVTTGAPLADMLNAQDNPTVVAQFGGRLDVTADASREVRTQLGFSNADTILEIVTLGWTEPLSQAA